MASLGTSEVERQLAAHSGWQRRGDEIHKEFEFADFRRAMTFVNRVADAANEADHHPDIDIRYNRVAMSLSTHSEGGITEKDFDLASKIDAAAA